MKLPSNDTVLKTVIWCKPLPLHKNHHCLFETKKSSKILIETHNQRHSYFIFKGCSVWIRKPSININNLWKVKLHTNCFVIVFFLLDFFWFSWEHLLKICPAFKKLLWSKGQAINSSVFVQSISKYKPKCQTCLHKKHFTIISTPRKPFTD